MKDFSSLANAQEALRDPATTRLELSAIKLYHPELSAQVAAHPNSGTPDGAELPDFVWPDSQNGNGQVTDPATKQVNKTESAQGGPIASPTPNDQSCPPAAPTGPVAQPWQSAPPPLAGSPMQQPYGTTPNQQSSQARVVWLVVVIGVILISIIGWILLQTGRPDIPLPGQTNSSSNSPTPASPLRPCLDGNNPVRITTLCGSGDDRLSAVAVAGNGDLVAVGLSGSDDGDFAGNNVVDSWGSGFLFTAGQDWPGVVKLLDGTWLEDVKTSADGGVVAAGSTVFGLSPIPGEPTYFANADGLVEKMDADGVVLWSQTVGTDDRIDDFNHVAVGADGTIVAVGAAGEVVEPYQSDLIMAAYNNDGSKRWEKDYGEVHDILGDYATGVAVADDGSIYLIAHTTLAKFSSGGVMEWKRNLSSGDLFTFEALIAVGDNIAATGGYVASDGGYQCFLEEIDGSGDIVWSTTFNDDMIVDVSGLAQATDGGFVVAGTVNGPTAFELMVLKFGADGSRGWVTKFDGDGQQSMLNVSASPPMAAWWWLAQLTLW